MKKIFLSILVAAAAFFGASNAQAQIAVNFTTDPMLPEYETMAKQVVEKQVTDPDGANKVFSKLLKKVMKSKEQSTAVGKFFLDNNIYPCAKQCSEAAYKCDYTYEPGLLLSVGVQLMRKKYGEAGAKLDEILQHNPDNIEARRLSARVYKYVNPYAAKSILEELMQIEPENIDAQKQLGDINYMLEDYKGCLEPYANYFAKTPNPDIMDLLSGENYLTALMLNNKFNEIIDLIPALEPLIDRNVDIIIPRMKFIAQMATMDYQGASQTVEYVASGRFNDSVYVDFDYLYGSLYYKDVVEDYGKALELQRKRIDLPGNKEENVIAAYLETADLYRKNGNPAEGVEYYEKYIELLGEKATVADKLLLGNYYNSVKMACATEEEKMAVIQKADKYYEEYMQQLPDMYQGPYYRAVLWTIDRANPNAEAVKWYDKAVEIIDSLPAEEQQDAFNIRKAALSNHLLFLAKSDEPNIEEIKKYVDAVLAMDPNDSLANQVKAFFK